MTETSANENMPISLDYSITLLKHPNLSPLFPFIVPAKPFNALNIPQYFSEN